MKKILSVLSVVCLLCAALACTSCGDADVTYENYNGDNAKKLVLASDGTFTLTYSETVNYDGETLKEKGITEDNGKDLTVVRNLSYSGRYTKADDKATLTYTAGTETVTVTGSARDAFFAKMHSLLKYLKDSTLSSAIGVVESKDTNGDNVVDDYVFVLESAYQNATPVAISSSNLPASVTVVLGDGSYTVAEAE